MANLLSSSGSGYGSGYGYGYGTGYGDGSGYGTGDGTGYGDGYGTGDGTGSGYGSGYGYGDGYGTGDGTGYGSGEQVDLAGIEYEAEIIKPFNLLKIGCQTHTIKYWKANWEQIADDNELGIDDATAQKAIATVERLLLP